MSLTIIKSGLLDTLQDMGRYHAGKWGINPGGAMDRFAAEAANLLVGNEAGEAVLEMHFPGPQILFEQNTLIAVTGGDFSPMLDDQPMPLWQPVVMRKNTVLHFPKRQWGARAYLAIHGGFCVPRWLNSSSTNLRAGAGGFEGRALKKSDMLAPRESTLYFPAMLKENKNLRILPWRVDADTQYQPLQELRVLEGHEWPHLDQASRNLFLDTAFQIHASSDRMGYHLRGPALELQGRQELISSPVSFGTVQLLPNGQLVVLMADYQTTGGYPRVAHVISADLNKLAQLQSGETLRFVFTSPEEAEELLVERRKELCILGRACLDHLNGQLC